MQLSTQELGRNLQKHIKNLETSSMEYGLPGWRASSAPDAPLPPVATIAYRDHPQKASMFDDVFNALALAEGDQNFAGDVEENKFKDGQPRNTMHTGATYDGHRSLNWHQLPSFSNGHHVPSEQHSGAGHLTQFMPQQQVHTPPHNNQQPPTPQSFAQQYPRSGVNGIYPSPPFSTSGQVMSSPPPHSGSFEVRPMSATSHPGSMEHHSPNSGYSTPHGAYTTPPPSHTPHTPAKSPSSFQNGSSDLSSNGLSPHKDEVVVSHQHQVALSAAISSSATSPAIISTGPPPLVPVSPGGYTLAPSMPNSAQVISVNQFQQDQSDKKLTVPPISTLLTPVSAQNTPSTMHINATDPISQPENISQEVHASVLPPLETVMRDNHHHHHPNHKPGFMHHLPEQTEIPPHIMNQVHHLSDSVRIEMNMPDIIQTHTCHKCRSIECSCDPAEISNIQRSRLQCQRCHKMFSYEKRLEQHLDTCKAKGGHHPQVVQKSGDPTLQCPGCGKQFKSIRWLEWHKENKCSVIDKNVKLEEFRQKVEKLQARAEFESRQERGEHLPQYIGHHNQHLPEFNNVIVKQENEMRCRKCSTIFSDEGLLRGHEEVCHGAIVEVGTQGMSTMYAKESYIDSGLGTPSPTFKARSGGTGGGRGRKRSHMANYDPTACSSPSQSSDGSTNGDSQSFPTRLHQGRYVCGICEASFTFQTNLTRHQRKLHGKPYVRNPRKGEKESPNNRESRSPTSYAESTYEPNFMSAHHMAQPESRVYHQEVPIHHDVMLNQDSSLSNDNTEMSHMMEQPQAAVKVESASSNGSPTEHYTDISYETHTIPYNAL